VRAMARPKYCWEHLNNDDGDDDDEDEDKYDDVWDDHAGDDDEPCLKTEDPQRGDMPILLIYSFF